MDRSGDLGMLQSDRYSDAILSIKSEYVRNQRSINAANKRLILGCALTGAKFTPKNHKITGDKLLDDICSGRYVPTTFQDIEREVYFLYASGCRYVHIHARNPLAREQSCENSIYRQYNYRFLPFLPDFFLSYGASRNGREVEESLKRGGEWERVSQAALPLLGGGAHFVTLQAAVELQIIKDLERQGYINIDEAAGTFDWAKSPESYVPNKEIGDLSLEVHSTHGGKNYGSSSAAVQHDALQQAVTARFLQQMPQEVEWVQFARSQAMTAYASKFMKPNLMQTGRLNITLLFGFSPKLPFPSSYEQFRRTVTAAQSIALCNKISPCRVTVTVGAAVLPHHAQNFLLPLNKGTQKGRQVSPLERLVAYTSQPDSGVDVLRFGMEDTPYLIDEKGKLWPADNLLLLETVLREVNRNEAGVITEGEVLRAFRSCPGYHADSGIQNVA